MPRIRRIDIPQLVRVRKYEVDCEGLRELLRTHKRIAGKSNKALAEALGVPATKVEHWFRTDSCFAIPDAELWESIKAELGITSTEFDEAITTYEERPGVYEKSERCYLADGIAPTLTSASAGNEKIIVEANDMQSNETCVATNSEQQDGVVTLSYTRNHQSKETDISPCLQASYSRGFSNNNPYPAVSDCLRIRKLTPKECFRLMGFDDEDFENAEAVNSNTQLYKQAGNSIGVPVVEHILTALFDCGALVK
jgi:DNA (cytosine-5)-methyltransferase 1